MVNYIRDGKRVWPHCTECGCRLNIDFYGADLGARITHFGIHYEKDARGHKCILLGESEIVNASKVLAFI